MKEIPSFLRSDKTERLQRSFAARILVAKEEERSGLMLCEAVSFFHDKL